MEDDGFMTYDSDRAYLMKKAYFRLRSTRRFRFLMGMGVAFLYCCQAKGLQQKRREGLAYAWIA
jgi:hypothetical protein